MKISYKHIHYAGLSVFLLVLLLMGAATHLIGTHYLEPFETTADELSKLHRMVANKDALEKSREHFDLLIKGKHTDIDTIIYNTEFIINNTDFIIESATATTPTFNLLEKQQLEKIIRGVKRLRVIVTAFAQERTLDPTGDNTRQLEAKAFETKTWLNREMSIYISEFNAISIQNAQSEFKTVLERGVVISNTILVVGVILGLAASLFMVHALKRPLRNLNEGTQKLAGGDLGYRIMEITRDEIGELALSFNHMADNIQCQSLRIEEEMQQRRKSEAKYRLILEEMEAGYFEIDQQGRFVFYNRNMHQSLDYNETELAGLTFVQLLHPSDGGTFQKAVERINSTGIPEPAFECTMKNKDGEKRTFNISLSLIKSDAGNLGGLRGVARDITEQKRVKQLLQRAQKMESIGVLAGGVAHDLNNILSGIVSYPELILLDLPKDSPLQNPIKTIQTSGEKAAAIVQDLLTLARRGIVVKEVTNLNALIQAYIDSPEFEKLGSYHPNVRFNINLDDTLFNTLGSPVHLTKSIMNLASNAAEAIDDLGTVVISTENRYIDRTFSSFEQIDEGDYVVLTVSDDGQGISKKDLQHIFEPFYTKKRMGRSGTGLGMAVVWGTIKDHHGFIDVDTTEGSGTKFSLYFPASRDEITSGSSGPTINDIQGNSENILIVDDVKEQRDITSSILRRLGYSPSALPSGEAAVDYLKNHSVDLVILDMIMEPGMDGLDTYKAILQIHPEQKAIIGSGFARTERIKKAQRLGAGAFVKKPFSIQTIGTAVKRELGRK
jgi:PAS domain S-box-containing protein